MTIRVALTFGRAPVRGIVEVGKTTQEVANKVDKALTLRGPGIRPLVRDVRWLNMRVANMIKQGVRQACEQGKPAVQHLGDCIAACAGRVDVVPEINITVTVQE